MVLLKFKVLQHMKNSGIEASRKIVQDALHGKMSGKWQKTLFTLTGESGSHLGTAWAAFSLQGTDPVTLQHGPP